MLSNAKAAVEAKAATPAKVGPSLSLDRYAGQYKDPWYGRITVAQGKSGLAINFNETPRMSGPLEHYQYDTFIARFDDKGIEPAYVTFGLDAEGKVDRITMKPVSPTADFSFDYQDLNFTPVASAGSLIEADMTGGCAWLGGLALQRPRWRWRCLQGSVAIRRGAGVL